MTKNEVDKYEELLALCLGIFTDTGLVNFSRKLEHVIKSNFSEESVNEMFLEYEKFINFEEEKKKRMIDFGDESQMAVMRYHILNLTRCYSDKGEPVIIINQMPEDTNLKDNPLKNLTLIYEDEEIRDRDYARTRRIIN